MFCIYDIVAKYFNEKDYSFINVDTDGFSVALAHEKIDDCIKSELKDEFLAERNNYFVPEEGSSADKRWYSKQPLLLKSEAISDFALSLSPKLYILADLSGKFKAGMKGIQKSKNDKLLNIASYFDVLFDRVSELPKALNCGIRKGPTGLMQSYEQKKRAFQN